MVQHILEETARTGCRVYSMQSETTQYALDIIDESMTAANISPYTVSMTLDPIDPDFFPVTVSVSVNYSDVSWLNYGFMSGKTLTATCVMPSSLEPAPTLKAKTKKSKSKSKSK